MQASDYICKSTNLMDKWEAEARNWLMDNGFVWDAPFYRDGVFDASVWFDEKTICRPLFVLKEVHENIGEDNGLRKGCLSINFLGSYVGKISEAEEKKRLNKEDFDLWKGELTWRKLGALAHGIISSHEADEVDYHLFNGKNDSDMARYRDVLKKIAVINLKKLPGGVAVGSKESQSTAPLEMHVKAFKDNLRHQIRLISPTEIICCGTYELVQGLGLDMLNIPIISCYHPRARVSIQRYYYDTIAQLTDKQ